MSDVEKLNAPLTYYRIIWSRLQRDVLTLVTLRTFDLMMKKTPAYRALFPRPPEQSGGQETRDGGIFLPAELFVRVPPGINIPTAEEPPRAAARRRAQRRACWSWHFFSSVELSRSLALLQDSRAPLFLRRPKRSQCSDSKVMMSFD
ncbi:hypothetical protein EYF80_038415 [Liparis tanakae]|uniref:Uncharacterized protein n=1 Tax=Liparis tanakae TaxID=230148 RepID=A0A4Z2GCV0_9TELE|nr:hypothetical protein EYF80_038415 [Liparis tanakae]